ncbi:unnamed protein product [Peronospora farinosa]|uniref:Chromo domain-containing protein n=1 Tax=Peronospora farinosa TaxID=134698 RepID=A0AAV0TI40_9STRA|nr:unnamed protein product [Peronospora farinosa]
MITYPHWSNETDGDVDYESSGAADQETRKPTGSPYTNEAIEDSAIEEDSALDAGLSSPVALGCPNGSSGGHTPDGPSPSHRADPSPADSAATEQQQGRQPRVGGRNRHSYRAPPVLVDTEGNTRFLVGRLLAHRFVKRKLQILVQWKGYPTSFDSWEPVDALRVDVPGLVDAYVKQHQLSSFC